MANHASTDHKTWPFCGGGQVVSISVFGIEKRENHIQILKNWNKMNEQYAKSIRTTSTDSSRVHTKSCESANDVIPGRPPIWTSLSDLQVNQNHLHHLSKTSQIWMYNHCLVPCLMYTLNSS